MSKWTPGPWTVSVSKDEVCRADNMASVCQVLMTAKSSHNARLIAAAPDLYEAIQAAIDCGIVPVSSAEDGGASKYSKQVQVADQMRAALAKARGEV